MAPVDYIHEDQHYGVCNGNQDPSPTGLHKKRAAFRYRRAGNCRHNSTCAFEHFSVAAQVEAPSLPHSAYRAEHMFACHPLAQTPVYCPPGSQTHPFFLWQPYLLSSPPFDPRYGLARQAEAVPDYSDDESDPSSTESSSTPTSMDCMALDAVSLDRTELRVIRDIASPSSDFGINSSLGCGGYSYPVLPATKAEYVVGRERATSEKCLDQGSMATLPSPLSLPWQDDMQKKKPLAYKTKPCKFYTANGKCSSGEKCTFIHDPESKGNAEKSPTGLTPPVDAKLPPKPLSKYDDSRAKDFYPITWRVIGGGVMMGGKRQMCPAFAAGRCKYGNDCKLAHETELDTDLGFIEPKAETIRKAEALPQQPPKGTTPKRSQRHRSIKVSSPETQQQREPFPSITPRPQRPDVPALEGIEAAEKKGEEVVVPSARDAPTSLVHRRTQSMSMVPTSPPPLDATHSNYAAEL